MEEPCDTYLEASQAGRLLTKRKIPKKASTLATDRGRIERHIKPLVGSQKVGADQQKNNLRRVDVLIDRSRPLLTATDLPVDTSDLRPAAPADDDDIPF